MFSRGKRKQEIGAVFFCALFVAIVGCSQLVYELVVTATGNGSGTFVVSGADHRCSNDPAGQLSCTISYYPSDNEEPPPTVTLRAIPAENSVFLGWTGLCSGTDTCTVTVDEDKKVFAQFTKVDYGTITKTDSVGNSIVSGTFYGSKTMGGATLISAGDVDVFVVKQAPGSSVVAWAVRMGGSGTDFPQDLQVDSIGDILVQITGKSSVSIASTSYNCADPNQTLMVKLAGSDGSILWSRCLTP